MKDIIFEIDRLRTEVTERLEGIGQLIRTEPTPSPFVVARCLLDLQKFNNALGSMEHDLADTN